jgi:hypothetical protein
LASNSDNTSTTVGNALPQEKPEKSEKPTDQHPVRETSAPAVFADTEKLEKPEKPEKPAKPERAHKAAAAPPAAVVESKPVEQKPA